MRDWGLDRLRQQHIASRPRNGIHDALQQLSALCRLLFCELIGCFDSQADGSNITELADVVVGFGRDLRIVHMWQLGVLAFGYHVQHIKTP